MEHTKDKKYYQKDESSYDDDGQLTDLRKNIEMRIDTMPIIKLAQLNDICYPPEISPNELCIVTISKEHEEFSGNYKCFL